MVDHVFTGTCWDPQGSEELRFGWQMLKSALGNVPITQAPATDLPALWMHARQQMLNARAIADDALILLLRHPHVFLEPHCKVALTRALTDPSRSDAVGLQLAQGFDSRHPPPGYAPNYATVRGMERYVQGVTADLNTAAPDASRLISLTTAGALRAYTALNDLPTCHVPAAFGHDYSDYHSGRREEVIPLVPEDTQRVLDVGGGAGGFLSVLKKARGCETHLAENSSQACLQAKNIVDRVWEGDFFKQPFDVAFDCITLLDVLEHTQDPLAWLKRAKALLSSHGSIVMSIPNVGHWSVVADLLEGRWDYAPVGIHCITHLRFFTRHSINMLLDQAGLSLELEARTTLQTPPWWVNPSMQGRISCDSGSLDTYAYLLRARPT